MAIARGAGTEIIRCANFRVMDSTNQNIIIGVVHHIYTVLSVIVYADTMQAAGNHVRMSLIGYDSKAGVTAEYFDIFKQDMNTSQTFVWNDKFSFNGYEPADFTSGGLTVVADQDKLADQAGGAYQYLRIVTEHADDDVDIIVTYIDQNNA